MQFEDFKELVFRTAGKAGLREFELYYAGAERFSVTVFEGQVDSTDIAHTAGVGFRALHRGVMGTSFTEALDGRAARELVERAIESTRLCLNEEGESFQDAGAEYPEWPDRGTEPESIDPEKKIALAREMEQRALDADRRIVSVQHCTVRTGQGFVHLVNSLGLDITFSSGMAAAMLEPVAVQGQERKSGFAYAGAFRLEGLDTETLVQEAVDEAIDALGAGPLPTGEYEVVFSPRAMCDFLSAFSGCFSADAAQKGLSLLAGKEGTQIAAPVVNLMDDPLRKEVLGSVPFDDEGVPGQRKQVIGEGILHTLLHNRRTANRAGVKSTGNASRAGYAGRIGVAPTVFYLAPGNVATGDLLSECGNAVYITSIEGLHAGANAVSGDFSLSARGFWMEKGCRICPVEQITLSGNFYQVLRQITFVGDDLTFDLPSGSCYGSPTVGLGRLGIAGR